MKQSFWGVGGGGMTEYCWIWIPGYGLDVKPLLKQSTETGPLNRGKTEQVFLTLKEKLLSSSSGVA